MQKPCIDGDHIPLEPLEAIKQGSAIGIDVLIGTSDDEAFGYDELFQGLREFDLEQAVDEEYKDWLRKSKYLNFTKDKAKDDIRSLLLAYSDHLKQNNSEASIPDCFMKMNGHKYFWISTIRLAEALSIKNKNVFNYIWTFPGPHGSPFHGSGLPFILDGIKLPRELQ